MLKEKIIKVVSPTNLNPTDNKPIKFQDEADNKYILWKFNKQGESKAYTSYKQLPHGGDGSTIGIVYSEEPDSFTNKEGKTINFTKRTVVIIKDPSEIKPENQVMPPTTQPPVSPTSPQEAHTASFTPNSYQTTHKANTEPNWDKIAEGKVRHGVAIAYIEQGKKLSEETVKEINNWTKFIITGGLTEGLKNVPIYNQPNPPDEINIENIPF